MHRDLCRVVIEAIELGLDGLAGELVLVGRRARHLHQEALCERRQGAAAVREDPIDVPVLL